MSDFYVYLKLKNYDGTDISINTFPLRATSVSISVDKTIPAFPIPLSGLATGESITAALDLGMSNKRISVSGFILDTTLKKKFGKTSQQSSETVTNVLLTSHEIAQIIASSVDSTGVAVNQAVDEIVILIPSNVDSNFVDRDATDGIGARGDLIPFNFRARGDANSKDNRNVPIRNKFPDSRTDTGMRGYIASFNHTLSAETTEIEFQLEFVVAAVLP